jgi:hypothetical protein
MITVQIANEPFVNHSVGTINRGRQCSILSSGFLSTAMKKRKKIKATAGVTNQNLAINDIAGLFPLRPY